MTQNRCARTPFVPFRRRVLPGTAAAALGVLLLAGCGGGAAQPSSAASASAATGSARPSGAGGRGLPGVSGLVAQIDGHTLQVQDTSTQTAVTWSAGTRFTDTVAASLKDIRSGVCVTIRPPRGATSTGSPTSTPAASVTAASVMISAAVNGTCELGPRAGGFRGRGNGTSGTPGANGQAPGPTGQASGGPTTGRNGDRGGFAGGFGGSFGAFGTVTSVNGSGFTVTEAARPDGSGGTASARVVTVTVSSSTTFTRTATATAAALAVGRCVTAIGKADDTGAVAATSISIRPAVNGSCAFGRGNRGQANSAGGGSGA